MVDPRCTIRFGGAVPFAHWQAIAPVGADQAWTVDLDDAADIDEALDSCAAATSGGAIVRVLPDGSTYLGLAGGADDDDPRSIVDRVVQAADPAVASLPDAVLNAWRDRLLADPPSAGTQHWARQSAALRGANTTPHATDELVSRRALPEEAGARLDQVAGAGVPALRAYAAACWAVVSERVDGQAVQAMAVLVDRRNRESLRRVVGRTRQWAPIVVRVAPASSFADLEHAAEATCRAAEQWRELLPPEHPRPPVAIDVAFWQVWTLGPIPAEVVTASGWLDDALPTLRLVREPDAWYLEQRTPPGLDPTVDAWLQLLAADRPAAAIGDLPLATRSGASSGASTAGNAASMDRFTADLDGWRRERPSDPAVIDDAGTLTVGELWLQSGLIADQLRAGDVAGIRCERDRSFAIAVVGCLRARACFIPVDGREDDDDRLARADVTVVIEEATVVRSDRPSAGQGTSYAYAMATSGSMGSPKVALVPQPMLAAAIDRVGRFLDVGADDRYLHLAAFGFSSSIRQMLVPLANRAAVLICNGTRRTDPEGLLDWLDVVRPTVLDLTPTMLDALADGTRRLPDSVRTIVCASERLDPAVVRRLCEGERFTGKIVECYGTTETSGLVAVADGGATGGRAIGGEGTSVLTSLDGCSLHVLDRYLHPVRPGMAGELWVSAGSHPAGYLGAAETAAAFLPAPDGDGERMFRTGDVVRRVGSDSFAWIGRADDLVKVRGERVSLLQVASAAEAHPAVHRAVTILAEGSVGLGVAVERGLGLEPAALQRHLRDAGLGAGLPTRIAILDAFPVNESGKVDRGELRRAITAGGDQRAPVTGPATETERRLLGIWEDLLPDRQLGAEDDFFDVGGHSLKAAQLTNRIRVAFGRTDVGVIDVFEHPTIRTMARLLDQAEGAP